MLVEEAAPERSLSHTPIFQVMFVLQNLREEEMRVGGLEIRGEEFATESVKYELTMSLSEREGGMKEELSYNRAERDEETMERRGRHYVRMSQVMTDEADRRISES